MNESNKAKLRKNENIGDKLVISYTVDSFANGIAFGQSKLESSSDPRDVFALRLQDDVEALRLRSRYVFHKENPLHELEKSLMRLSNQGILHSATIYFGVTTDPFLPFESKFDASMKFLDLFQRYTPGMLIVQTRSPLIVLALPVLKRLGRHASVTIGIETPCEDVVRHYTPALPRVSERLKTVKALRKFGIEVTLQVHPVLPYGEWREDAKSFAKLLVENGDFLHVKALSDGSEQLERQLKASEIVRKLAHDRCFYYLRRDAAVPLINEIEAIASDKLFMPQRLHLKPKQIEFFAA
ncbi:MAG: hypothetical protein GYA55_14625 [SAR324 cluster bacterium]|uniref:Radical SAM protein n=1 Tax=SAR324 cluster bacterium TaxID=2024889 RepID=A0A7X9FUK4_9DELT|nr:hypothetical protein [SAR324 cluster bacterium]